MFFLSSKKGTLRIVGCSTPASVAAKIGLEVDSRISEGLALSDIAIVSLRGRDAESTLHRLDRVGRHAFVNAADPKMGDRLVADFFLHWKGLERPAVVVTDLPGPEVKQRDVRFYIALTWALMVARVVSTRESLQGAAGVVGDQPWVKRSRIRSSADISVSETNVWGLL